jgi:multidrug transporter EmrE-like cation transporter
MSEDKLAYWAALLVAVAANVAANTALKIAMSSPLSRSGRGLLLELLGKPSLWIGLVLCGVLLVSYLAALRGLPASVAYAMVTTLAMAGLLVVDSSVFGVPLSGTRLLGAAFAVSGVWLMTRL